MPSECIHTHELLTAWAGVWLEPAVDLGVPLQVVRPDEGFAAVDASVLSVAQMSLDVRANILAPLEAFPSASLEKTCKGVGDWIVLNERGYLLGRNASVFDDSL
jgi:hypothetical protein